ncbi:MAG: hypothetical protein WC588_02670 [Candidatus Micrarchaeia archaeon]
MEDEKCEGEKPTCDLCLKDLEGEDLKRWEKENSGLFRFMCSECEHLSHYEKTMLKRIDLLTETVIQLSNKFEVVDEAKERAEANKMSQMKLAFEEK